MHQVAEETLGPHGGSRDPYPPVPHPPSLISPIPRLFRPRPSPSLPLGPFRPRVPFSQPSGGGAVGRVRSRRTRREPVGRTPSGPTSPARASGPTVTPRVCRPPVARSRRRRLRRPSTATPSSRVTGPAPRRDDPCPSPSPDVPSPVPSPTRDEGSGARVRVPVLFRRVVRFWARGGLSREPGLVPNHPQSGQQ